MAPGAAQSTTQRLGVTVQLLGPRPASYVAANDGDETVPTIVVAGRPHVNPDPEWLRGQRRRHG